MARMAKKPIGIPPGVKVRIEGNQIVVEGPKGRLVRDLAAGLKIETQEKGLSVLKSEGSSIDKKILNARQGLVHALVKGMIDGVSAGFEKKLEIQGVGYRAAVEKGKLNMSLGFTHPVVMELPQGITVDVEKQTLLTVKGMDKYLVGEVASQIRRVKPPEVYKGTGIRYLGEYVRKKVGKTGATAKTTAK